MSEYDEALAPMLADRFVQYEHDTFHPGVRVRNQGEQYPEARQFGTAEVVAVLRKKGSWERKYGRLNIEVLVKRDRDDSLVWWADYGTRLAEGCWPCDGDGCDRCNQEPGTNPASSNRKAGRSAVRR